MTCCGGTYEAPAPPQPSAGEVLARPMWGGVMLYRGRVTGRLYGYISNARLVAVAIEDAQADPRLSVVAPAAAQAAAPAAASVDVEEQRAQRRRKRR